MNTMELNTIYNEDCLETMKRMPDGFVDLIVTDPPYGMNYYRHITEQKHQKIANDDNLQWLEESVKEWHRVLSGNGHLYAFCSWHKIEAFKSEISKHFHIKNILVWDKGGNGMGDLRTDYGNIHEFIIYACRYKNEQKALNGKRLPNIFSDARTGNKLHPTQKPETLVKTLIEKSSEEGETVYDPFMGSGTTARACKDLGRNYIGSEISKEYCDIAEDRLKQAVLL